MRARWIVNLVLLVLVAGIVAFLYLKPQEQEEQEATYEVSSLKLSDFDKLSIEFPAKAPVVFEKKDGFWYLAQPYAARADQPTVLQIVSIVAATSREKFSAEDPARFGLDNPRLKIRLNDEEFIFGLYNPVTSEQYVAYQDAVYLLSGIYSETAAIQLLEMLDKSPLKPKEDIAGFDFSRLEQWQEVRLQLDRDPGGKWQVSVPGAKPKQEEIEGWFDEFWEKVRAASVEPYTPGRQAQYPSFTVKLKDGGKVHFDKMQESPQLILGRPDEGMRYHFPADVGFTLLNPPIGLDK
ncbi:DUF4340 domain-containing protein [Methylobacillus flagellatus]|uniref:DUF4340 domain-containing protein n=1 Tax=Methylobacillus flagellatus (strain ATCC 51484 / DSM 6875 / VKM B-1610 / KT) TaxID=265072 RepID=Q1H3I4_METFK|nr:DUF4340 domain-containing protein [Methylobacillus flagellatus]ABE48953.1 hypothetical protein Mfla_0685 [Methylobacillus flagellatus KT]